MSKPIVPWIGGKRRLAKFILPQFPEHQTYVEPFCGAAALFFMKDPAKAEVINDVNGELMNLYRIVKHHLEPLIEEFRWGLVGRQQFEWFQKQPVEQLTDIQRAARFFYLQKLCFGGRVQSRNYGVDVCRPPRLNYMRVGDDLAEAHARLSAVTIEHLPWDTCVGRYDRSTTLFYCDPPYWETEGYGVDFGIEQYHRLAAAAKTIAGKMIISVNDHPEMRMVFDGLRVETTELKYTVGGQKATSDKSRELVIFNW